MKIYKFLCYRHYTWNLMQIVTASTYPLPEAFKIAPLIRPKSDWSRVFWNTVKVPWPEASETSRGKMINSCLPVISGLADKTGPQMAPKVNKLAVFFQIMMRSGVQYLVLSWKKWIFVVKQQGCDIVEHGIETVAWHSEPVSSKTNSGTLQRCVQSKLALDFH